MANTSDHQGLGPDIFLHGYKPSEIARLDSLDMRQGRPSMVEWKNVLCVPPYCVLFDERGDRISLTARSYRPPDRYRPTLLAKLLAKLAAKEPAHVDPPQSPDVIDEPVLFAGMHTPHYGHLLTDGVSRLWCHEELRSCSRFFYQGLGASVAEDHDLSRRILEAGGVDFSRRLHVARPTLFRRLRIPIPSMQSDRRIYTAHADLLAAAAKAMIGGTNTESQPVYLSRSALAPEQRGANNEMELEAALTTRGVPVIHPEKLPLTEQLALFNGRRMIASCSGSALHTILFSMNRGEGMTLVNLTLPFIDHRYPLVDGISRHESHYLNACTMLPGESDSRGRFMIDVPVVLDFLAERKFF